MNVETDIKIFDIRKYSAYIDDGWREGFNTTWSGTYANNSFYKNTILVQSNFIRSTTTLNPNGGNGYEDVNTFAGFKFLYKPISATKIQWVLLYIFVRDVDNGNKWFHRFGNLYSLVVDGKQMVDMPKESSGVYKDFSDYTAPVLTNGAGSKAVSVNAINGTSVKVGMIIPPTQSASTVLAGTTQVVFYGTFTPTSHTTSNAQSFNVEFTYSNWAYMSAKQGESWTTATAIALSPKNWGKVTSWSMASQKNYFRNKTYKTSDSAFFTDTTTVTTLADTYASYGQTIKTSGGKYVYLSSSGAPNWNSGWQSSPCSQKLITDSSNNFPTKSRATLLADTSFWNSSNYGSNWCARETVNLQYAPNISGYTQTDITQEGENVGVSIQFKQATPSGKAGYFNAVKILKSGSSYASYVEHNFTSSGATISIVRDPSTGILTITSSNASDTIITTEQSLNVGTDAFTLYIYPCYHNVADTGHENDLEGTQLRKQFKQATAPDPEPLLEITSFDLIYPLDSAGVTHLIKRADETYKTDFCVNFSITAYENLGYAYLSIRNGDSTIKGRRFSVSSGTNKIKLNDVDFTETDVKSFDLRLTITDNTDPGTGDSYPDSSVLERKKIPVSIKKHSYNTSTISLDHLINSDRLESKLLKQVGVTISNFQTLSNAWKSVFEISTDVYAWDADYLGIIDEQLVTISIRNLLDKMIEFYTAVKSDTNANGYYTSSGTQESILKDNSITEFIYDRGSIQDMQHQEVIDEVTWDQFAILVNDANDLQFVEEVDEQDEYALTRQNVQYRSGDRYMLRLTGGVDDLIVAEDVVVSGTTIIIFNNFQRVILYMVTNLL